MLIDLASLSASLRLKLIFARQILINGQRPGGLPWFSFLHLMRSNRLKVEAHAILFAQANMEC